MSSPLLATPPPPPAGAACVPAARHQCAAQRGQTVRPSDLVDLPGNDHQSQLCKCKWCDQGLADPSVWQDHMATSHLALLDPDHFALSLNSGERVVIASFKSLRDAGLRMQGANRMVNRARLIARTEFTEQYGARIPAKADACNLDICLLAFVVDVDRCVALGYALAFWRETCYDGGVPVFESHIDQLAVIESARGQHVGRALVRYVINHKWHGSADISLWSPVGLQPFYRDLGFVSRAPPCGHDSVHLDADHVYLLRRHKPTRRAGNRGRKRAVAVRT